jgi:hypothetical protein
LPGLYDLLDAKAFIEGAEKEIGPGKPGLAKLAWILYGPAETKDHRADAAAAMLRSGEDNAVKLFANGVGHLQSEDYKKLIEGVKDNANGSLFVALERLGAAALMTAPKEVMNAVQAYEASGGAPNKKWISNIHLTSTAEQLDELKTPGATEAALWLLKHAGSELLTHLNAAGAMYLKSKNLDVATLGIDASTRAAFVHQQAKDRKRYWSDPYYSTWESQKNMPEQVLFALGAPGSTPQKMVYDDTVLEMIRSHLLKWEWTRELVEGFIKRAVDLPTDWAHKLRDVFPKPATEDAKA